jgi:hypothetical protein
LTQENIVVDVGGCGVEIEIGGVCVLSGVKQETDMFVEALYDPYCVFDRLNPAKGDDIIYRELV